MAEKKDDAKKPDLFDCSACGKQSKAEMQCSECGTMLRMS